MRPRRGGDRADRRLPVLLRLQVLRYDAAAEARPLLRFLLIRQRAVPADAAAGRQPLRPPPTLPMLMSRTSGRIGWFMSWLSVITLVLTMAMLSAVEIGHMESQRRR
jgi:hypothetical protein